MSKATQQDETPQDTTDALPAPGQFVVFDTGHDKIVSGLHDEATARKIRAQIEADLDPKYADQVDAGRFEIRSV